MSVPDAPAVTITPSDLAQIDGANASGRTPVVFIHGLWLLPSSWDRWATVFDDAGFASLTPGWPDDPTTVEEANAHPEVVADKTIGQIADHYAAVIARLDRAGYHEISRAHLIDPTNTAQQRDVVWSHPAFANRSVYLRNDREIRCISLAAE